METKKLDLHIILPPDFKDCERCVERLRTALLRLDGMREVEVNTERSSLMVTHDRGALTMERIEEEARHELSARLKQLEDETKETAEKKAEELVMSEVKRLFNPEFLNRLDETIVFDALTEDDLLRILDLMVGTINQNLAAKNISVTVSPAAANWILVKTCGDRSYGARPLRRALQKYVEDPLSEALIQGSVQPPAVLEIVVENEALYYRSVDDRLVAALPLSR